MEQFAVLSLPLCHHLKNHYVFRFVLCSVLLLYFAIILLYFFGQ